jgi:hypothetical protein
VPFAYLGECGLKPFVGRLTWAALLPRKLAFVSIGSSYFVMRQSVTRITRDDAVNAKNAVVIDNDGPRSLACSQISYRTRGGDTDFPVAPSVSGCCFLRNVVPCIRTGRAWGLENGGIKTTSSCFLQIQRHQSPKVMHLIAEQIDNLRVLCE